MLRFLHVCRGHVCPGMAAWLLLCLGPTTLAFHTSTGAVNNRPIVGILTQPLGVELASALVAGESHPASNRTYIAASYVKFAESAGARVVPLHYDASDDELRSLFGQINGVIFPGGGTDVKRVEGNRFREAGQLLFQLALDANKGGDVFPIHGTCLGLQMLGVMAAEDDAVLCENCFEGVYGNPLPLSFAANASSSRLFEGMPKSLMNAMATQNITENSHNSGIDPAAFFKAGRLHVFFRVLSTNVDTKGRPFVSTMEARHFPITGTQWHPEKNNFEWGGIGNLGEAAIPHSAEAVLVSQYFANFFVGIARASHHRFASPAAEAVALIDNCPLVVDPSGYYCSVYIWERGVFPGSRDVHRVDTVLV